LHRFDYASRKHVICRLIWRIGIRLGGLRAIDVDDLDFEDKAIKIRHRSDTGTLLKNQFGGERDVGINETTVHVLEDYIGERRIEKTDDHGREPLISTSEGRMSTS
jgi:integrase